MEMNKRLLAALFSTCLVKISPIQAQSLQLPQSFPSVAEQRRVESQQRFTGARISEDESDCFENNTCDYGGENCREDWAYSCSDNMNQDFYIWPDSIIDRVGFDFIFGDANSHLIYDKNFCSPFRCSDYTVNGRDVDIEYLWNEVGTRGSKGERIIALIDTGVDPYDEHLRDVLWVNEDEIYGNGIDDDNNGFIDDRYGYDFWHDSGDTSLLWHPGNSFHGTYLARIIAGAHNSEEELRENGLLRNVGVDSGAVIMNLKTFGINQNNDVGIASARAIRYAVDNGASIINLSLGSVARYPAGDPRDLDLSYHVETVKALDYAWQRGCIIVASSGNRVRDPQVVNINDYHFPSGHPAVIAVGGLYGEFKMFDHLISLPGRKVDLVLDHQISGGGTTYFPGTSNACAFVSGMISVLWSQFPQLNNVQMKERLLETAMDEIFSVGDRELYIGSKRADNHPYGSIGSRRFGELIPPEDTVAEGTKIRATNDVPGWDKYYGYGYPNFRYFIENERQRDVTVDPHTGSVNGYVLQTSIDPADLTPFQYATWEEASTVVGISSQLPRSPELAIYPNPVHDRFMISNYHGSWRIYSMSGQLLFEGKGNRVDVTALFPGVYLLVTGEHTKKFIVHR